MSRSRLPLYSPVPVNAAPGSVLDLAGAWAYLQPIADPIARTPVDSPLTLTVPGEVVMQGLPLDPSAPFALERIVHVPADWSGQTILLRFDAVYSLCTVWVDGTPVGHHLGGSTPFDLDLTTLVTPGEPARITLHVTNNSVADTHSYGSKYAFHPLAGVPRKVTLLALPAEHLARLDVATIFEPGKFDRADLQVDLVSTMPGQVGLELVKPDGTAIALGSHEVDGEETLSFPIDGPELWHTENPALYTLRARLGETLYERRVGFRDVRVESDSIVLNGRSIYLRGANHHETHPLTGRADTARWAKTDVALFRAANVNFLRTSHYPPTIELVEACDAAGMLLEVEAPVCFAFGQFGHSTPWADLSDAEQTAAIEYLPRVSLEMVAYYRSHPSVIVWSLGNESAWAPPFEKSAAAIRQADPTRPITFNWDKLQTACRGHVDIANHHYPEAGEVARFASEGRPIMFDEFAHLYCYNWRELATDPGLRQWWGKFLEQQWEEIRASRNGIGGSIWAAIDDYFLVPQRDGTSKWLGYGEWGPIDGWRRPKPEYEHLSRVFDPIKVKRDGASITVENRFDFTDLSEVECTWEAAGQSGRQRLSAEPGQSARFELPPALSAATCTLDFKLARLAYHRRLEVFASSEAAPEAAPASELLEVSKDGDAIRLGAWSIEEREQPAVVTPDGVRIPLSLAIVPAFPSWEITKRPAGKVLALDNILTGWELSARQVGKDRVDFLGAYGSAKGRIGLAADAAGHLIVDYDFELLETVSPLQVGIALDLPATWDELSWRLAGPANDLPADHLSRSAGSARARPISTESPLPTSAPAGPWKDDANERGSNDFRATKLGIAWASLGDDDGRGVTLHASGRQHARAEVTTDGVRLFALDWTGEGSERFLATFAEVVNWEKGHRLSGSFRLSSSRSSPATQM